MTTPPPIPLAQQIAHVEATVKTSRLLPPHPQFAIVEAILASLQSLEARVVAAKREGMEEATEIICEIYKGNELDENYSMLPFTAEQICKAIEKRERRDD